VRGGAGVCRGLCGEGPGVEHAAEEVHARAGVERGEGHVRVEEAPAQQPRPHPLRPMPPRP
jgi:hypothetical protein